MEKITTKEIDQNNSNQKEYEDEDEMIKEACLKGDISKIKKYIFSDNTNNNFDINKIFNYTTIDDRELSSDTQGSLLHICCEKGYLEITKLLCTHPNINLNQKNGLGETPFHLACIYDQLNIIEFLYEIPEIDINLTDNNGWTPLYYSCYYKKNEIVKIILKQQKNRRIEINKQNKYDGNSPLHIVCYYSGNLEIVKLICEEQNNTNGNDNNKIDINVRDSYGRTPFFIACQNGNLEIVKYLFLKYKNNNNFYENQISDEGFSPLHFSCLNGKIEIVKFLLENNFNEIEI